MRRKVWRKKTLFFRWAVEPMRSATVSSVYSIYSIALKGKAKRNRALNSCCLTENES